jgi:hypothetical protein
LLGLVYFSSSWSDTIIKDGHFELDRFINNTKKMGQ